MLFEGRDAAGKGGGDQAHRREPEPARTAASSRSARRPSASAAQWYFQRYVAHLPAAGEIVLFDRSWYNRAGVERVMGFCTDEEYAEFLRACPLFEEMLIRSGIILVKYWFSVSDEEQERRFQERIDDPDQALEAVARWTSSRAATGSTTPAPRTRCSPPPTPTLAPWYVVDADDKRRARLNCITHLLKQVPYEEIRPVKIWLAPRQKDGSYVRPAKDSQRWVEAVY